jgi:hypothetical protein
MNKPDWSPLRWTLTAVGAVLALLGAVVGILWLSDYAVAATITDKDCGTGLLGSASSKVTVKTETLGLEHTVKGIDNNICHIMTAGRDGNYVVYHVRSEHTILYESERGPC